MMNIIGIAKGLFDMTVGASTGLVVGHIIGATTPANLGRVGRIGVKIGTVVLSSIIAEQAVAHTDRFVDTLKKVMDEAEVAMTEAQAENAENAKIAELKRKLANETDEENN